jgi:hypothetical protein
VFLAQSSSQPSFLEAFIEPVMGLLAEPTTLDLLP